MCVYWLASWGATKPVYVAKLPDAANRDTRVRRSMAVKFGRTLLGIG